MIKLCITPAISMARARSKQRGSKMSSCSMADFFHADIRREFIDDMLKVEGDFLIRKSANGKAFVVSVLWKGAVRHCQVVEQNVGSFPTYTFGVKEFKTVEELIQFHYLEKVPLTDDNATQLLNPVKSPKTKYKESDIEVITKLGGGNFGDVFKVRIKSENLLCAMKTLKSSVNEAARESFRKELDLMKTLKHENIVHFIGMVVPDKKSSDEMKILLELINQGSLDKLLLKGKVTDRGKCKICLQVSKGMQYIHKHHIIHRDLAARNILVTSTDDGGIIAKVSDFGLSRVDDSGHGYELKSAQKLPLKWLAPECFTERCWTTASDVWSFGVMMWEVFTDGKQPYYDSPIPSGPCGLQKFISTGGHPTKPEGLPDDLWEVFKKCWVCDRNQRASMDEIVADLERVYKKMH